MHDNEKNHDSINSIKSLKYNDVCKLLGLSRTGLNKLMKRDLTFPKIIKNGNSKQAGISFSYEELLAWYKNKLLKR